MDCSPQRGHQRQAGITSNTSLPAGSLPTGEAVTGAQGTTSKNDSDQGLQISGALATVFCHLPISATCVRKIIWLPEDL